MREEPEHENNEPKPERPTCLSSLSRRLLDLNKKRSTLPQIAKNFAQMKEQRQSISRLEPIMDPNYQTAGPREVSIERDASIFSSLHVSQLSNIKLQEVSPEPSNLTTGVRDRSAPASAKSSHRRSTSNLDNAYTATFAAP